MKRSVLSQTFSDHKSMLQTILKSHSVVTSQRVKLYLNLIQQNFHGPFYKSVFLNRRDASQYRDLETFSPGLGTLEKLKIYQKLQWNKVFLI